MNFVTAKLNIIDVSKHVTCFVIHLSLLISIIIYFIKQRIQKKKL